MKNTKLTRIFVLILSLALLIGSIATIAVSAEENGEAASCSIKSINISHGDKIRVLVAVDYAVKTAAEIGETDLATIKNPGITVNYTMNDTTSVAKYWKYMDIYGDGNYYPIFYTVGIAPKDMGEDIIASATVGDVTSAEQNISVAHYLYYKLYREDYISATSGTSLTKKEFYQRMLEYGASAQKVLWNNNAENADDQRTLVTDLIYVWVKDGVLADGTSSQLLERPGRVTVNYVGARRFEGWKVTTAGETTYVNNPTVYVTDHSLIVPSTYRAGANFDFENDAYTETPRGTANSLTEAATPAFNELAFESGIKVNSNTNGSQGNSCGQLASVKSDATHGKYLHIYSGTRDNDERSHSIVVTNTGAVAEDANVTILEFDMMSNSNASSEVQLSFVGASYIDLGRYIAGKFHVADANKWSTIRLEAYHDELCVQVYTDNVYVGTLTSTAVTKSNPNPVITTENFGDASKVTFATYNYSRTVDFSIDNISLYNTAKEFVKDPSLTPVVETFDGDWEQGTWTELTSGDPNQEVKAANGAITSLMDKTNRTNTSGKNRSEIIADENGNSYLHVYSPGRVGGPNDRSHSVRIYPETLSNKINSTVIEFDYYYGSAMANTGIRFGIRGGGQYLIFSTNPSADGMLFTHGSKAKICDMEEWVKLKFVINYAAKSVAFYVDGEYLCDLDYAHCVSSNDTGSNYFSTADEDKIWTAFNSKIAYFEVGTYNDGRVIDFCLDNVAVYHTYDPACEPKPVVTPYDFSDGYTTTDLTWTSTYDKIENHAKQYNFAHGIYARPAAYSSNTYQNGGDAEVLTDKNGNQYLHVWNARRVSDTTRDRGWNAVLAKTSEDIAGSSYAGIVELDLKLDSAITYTEGEKEVTYNSGTYDFFFYFSSSKYVRYNLTLSDGVFQMYGASGTNTFSKTTLMSADMWYTLRFELDVINHTINVYSKPRNWDTWQTTFTIPADATAFGGAMANIEGTISYLQICGGNSNTTANSYSIDNVSVYNTYVPYAPTDSTYYDFSEDHENLDNNSETRSYDITDSLRIYGNGETWTCPAGAEFLTEADGNRYFRMYGGPRITGTDRGWTFLLAPNVASKASTAVTTVIGFDINIESAPTFYVDGVKYTGSANSSTISQNTFTFADGQIALHFTRSGSDIKVAGNTFALCDSWYNVRMEFIFDTADTSKNVIKIYSKLRTESDWSREVTIDTTALESLANVNGQLSSLKIFAINANGTLDAATGTATGACYGMSFDNIGVYNTYVDIDLSGVTPSVYDFTGEYTFVEGNILGKNDTANPTVIPKSYAFTNGITVGFAGSSSNTCNAEGGAQIITEGENQYLNMYSAARVESTDRGWKLNYTGTESLLNDGETANVSVIQFDVKFDSEIAFPSGATADNATYFDCTFKFSSGNVRFNSGNNGIGATLAGSVFATFDEWQTVRMVFDSSDDSILILSKPVGEESWTRCYIVPSTATTGGGAMANIDGAMTGFYFCALERNSAIAIDNFSCYNTYVAE